MMGSSISSAILVPNRGDDVQYPNGSKHEARSEYEREIKQTSLQNLHDGRAGCTRRSPDVRFPRHTWKRSILRTRYSNASACLGLPAVVPIPFEFPHLSDTT